jgi:hypothetical protein
VHKETAAFISLSICSSKQALYSTLLATSDAWQRSTRAAEGTQQCVVLLTALQ